MPRFRLPRGLLRPVSREAASQPSGRPSETYALIGRDQVGVVPVTRHSAR